MISELSVDEQREMYEDVKTLKRLLIGESIDGQSVQAGLVVRIHKLEKAKRDNDIRAASISGIVTGIVLTLKWILGK